MGSVAERFAIRIVNESFQKFGSTIARSFLIEIENEKFLIYNIILHNYKSV